MNYKFSDDVLSGIVQLVQLALLTETDISDHLRLLEVEPDSISGRVKLTAECLDQLQRNVDDLNKRAAELLATLASKS